MPLSTSRALYEAASARALALPATELYRFSPRSDAEAARVAGKWFMLLAEKDGTQLVNLKAHPAARPAWHMNKTHWYSLVPHSDVTGELLAELIAESYLTVVESLPARKRPPGWQDLAEKLKAAESHPPKNPQP
ncbi:MAG: MmcQ/YjbR family DNA-binding protein [Rothia sp. (in: high G+C Gram-positive bacteria)]|uniref:MmcQ/YjbR family DNA-binding protein n=1 Tax=Rothia sp. (in: high G+C Gram-positive bacteria) TaxID=1885016 RepID=UPI0026FD9C3B|nr:MmcQ/YjbR family DNA-binding protein [Rothia sp. (in: high G+C Gram-positive bacteria)]